MVWRKKRLSKKKKKKKYPHGAPAAAASCSSKHPSLPTIRNHCGDDEIRTQTKWASHVTTHRVLLQQQQQQHRQRHPQSSSPAAGWRQGVEGGEGKHLSPVRHLLPQMTQSDCGESRTDARVHSLRDRRTHTQASLSLPAKMPPPPLLLCSLLFRFGRSPLRSDEPAEQRHHAARSPHREGWRDGERAWRDRMQ